MQTHEKKTKGKTPEFYCVGQKVSLSSSAVRSMTTLKLKKNRFIFMVELNQAEQV